MNRAQKYISVLLERLPKWELRSYEHQTTLDRIRDRITSASDINVELNSLYRVKGFNDFALSLMWIADKVEKDTSLDESTLAEETLVFEKLRYALGDVTGQIDEQPGVEKTTDLPQPSDFETSTSDSAQNPPPAPAAIETPDVLLDSWGKEPQAAPHAAPSGEGPKIGNEQERSFAALMERLLESIQSGNDDRTSLLSNVLNECNLVETAVSAPDEYKQFCKLLVEFLNYISTNQYLDDIRVMNIVSNIQDPLNQWAQSDQTDRVGLLEPAIEILRDFKTMFE